ncbi:MAG: VOC family protein [Saprospiraceae bacterium]|nr:VOC family protein [Saprospiraceae bacterium]
MRLEHIAIWTNRLEILRGYYEQYFGAKANDKYINPTTGFESYFLTFESGARLEIMSRPNIPNNLNDTVEQYLGLIHFAFEVKTMQEVDEKMQELQQAGYRILRGPRKTGDGYYEFETLDPDGNRLEVQSLFISVSP